MFHLKCTTLLQIILRFIIIPEQFTVKAQEFLISTWLQDDRFHGGCIFNCECDHMQNCEGGCETIYTCGTIILCQKPCLYSNHLYFACYLFRHWPSHASTIVPVTMLLIGVWCMVLVGKYPLPFSYMFKMWHRFEMSQEGKIVEWNAEIDAMMWLLVSALLQLDI